MHNNISFSSLLFEIINENGRIYYDFDTKFIKIWFFLIYVKDVLREKQNHIEQLLLERDLDRQDSESQSIDSQRSINQVSYTIDQIKVFFNFYFIIFWSNSNIF